MHSSLANGAASTRRQTTATPRQEEEPYLVHAEELVAAVVVRGAGRADGDLEALVLLAAAAVAASMATGMAMAERDLQAALEELRGVLVLAAGEDGGEAAEAGRVEEADVAHGPLEEAVGFAALLDHGEVAGALAAHDRIILFGPLVERRRRAAAHTRAQ